MPAKDVPDGKDEKDNKELRKSGEPKTVPGAKEHFELGEKLGLMDFDTAAKLSGARFTMLKGALARLERALGELHARYSIRSEFGYTEVSPPLLVNDKTMYGTGQLPKFVDDQFRTTTDGLWIGIPTAEVPLTNIVNDDMIVKGDKLPLRFTAKTPCFRAEAGAAGKDTRGMLRQHQFYKVEMVSITTPDQSDAEHERMTACAETASRNGSAYCRFTPQCFAQAIWALRRYKQDVRYRSLDAGTKDLSRNFKLLQLRRFPGAAHERAL